MAHKNVGVILSGGNIERARLLEVLAGGNLELTRVGSGSSIQWSLS